MLCFYFTITYVVVFISVYCLELIVVSTKHFYSDKRMKHNLMLASPTQILTSKRQHGLYYLSRQSNMFKSQKFTHLRRHKKDKLLLQVKSRTRLRCCFSKKTEKYNRSRVGVYSKWSRDIPRNLSDCFCIQAIQTHFVHFRYPDYIMVRPLYTYLANVSVFLGCVRTTFRSLSRKTCGCPLRVGSNPDDFIAEIYAVHPK